jgi:hypothetical protein
MEKAPMLMRSLSRAAAFLAERVYEKLMMDIHANNSKGKEIIGSDLQRHDYELDFEDWELV